jgi:hypothetical protein
MMEAFRTPRLDRLARDAFPFGTCDMCHQHRGDLLGHLVLHRKDVLSLSIVALRPTQ